MTYIDIRSGRKIENHVSLEKVGNEHGAIITGIGCLEPQLHIILITLSTKVETLCPKCREENEKGIKIMILDNGMVVYECKRCEELIWAHSLLAQIDSDYQAEYDRQTARKKELSIKLEKGQKIDRKKKKKEISYE